MLLDAPSDLCVCGPTHVTCASISHLHLPFNWHLQQFIDLFYSFSLLFMALENLRDTRVEIECASLIHRSFRIHSEYREFGHSIAPFKIWLRSSLTHRPHSGFGESKLPVPLEPYRHLFSVWWLPDFPHANHLSVSPDVCLFMLPPSLLIDVRNGLKRNE